MSNAWILVPFLLLQGMGCTKSQSGSSAKAPLTADQTLSKLIVIADQLEPAFDPFVNEYTLAGGETYKNKLTINTAPVNAKLQVVINGVKLRSDFTTDPMPLAAGSNLFTINLVDSAGTTINSYKLNAQRIQDLPDETLADIATSNGDLAPPFSPDITSYQLDVSANTTELT
ncbi:MAG: cadherin-like beta sandwich domain-containing protein, partial [Pseudobdellovibrionaceae bacterium]|nr:cadherin-like beta sandwich domain-containing protein [Pseudobdellovibrionaceae bacterium]